MSRSTGLLFCFLSLLFAGAPAAFACVSPREAQIFDLAGLKSELMVTAIACNADSDYNTFIRRFRTELLADDQQLGAYFQQKYGRASQAAHDAYTTNVANKMSENGVKQGTNFCLQHLALFSEVLRIQNVSDLRLFAMSRGYVDPVSPERCRTAGMRRAEIAEPRR